MTRIAFLTAAFFAATLSAASAAPETYKLDPSHTAVIWHINHFGFSNPSGKFMSADGTLVLDQENPATSKVDVTIQVAGIDSGVPKLDEHLKSKDFFDVATYPTAHFVSEKVDVTGKNTALVHGNLTLHGVTKPVDLNVTLNKVGENMMKLQTAGFSATAQIKRSDFGINTYIPALSDEVTLEIQSEANVPAKTAAK
jgi:polyisoprenoid-binding protein YceI